LRTNLEGHATASWASSCRPHGSQYQAEKERDEASVTTMQINDSAGGYIKGGFTSRAQTGFRVSLVSEHLLSFQQPSPFATMMLLSLLLAIMVTVVPAISASVASPLTLSHGEKKPSAQEYKASHRDHGHGESICDKYTAQILGSNEPAIQRLLMSLFVNTAIVGNYTTPNIGER
jgi:hypothetical protein